MKNRKNILVVCSLLACLLFVQSCQNANNSDILSSSGNEKKKANVLIITGCDHPQHGWWETTPVLAKVLEEDKRLDVRIVEDPHFLDSAAIERYDVILLHFMDWEQPAPGKKARENLRAFVKGGKGLVLIHFACGAFQDWPEFANLAGRIWDPDKRGHDLKGSFRVEIKNTNHPVTQGMQYFETDDELYTCLVGDRPIEILATATSNVDGKEYPMAFVFNYGKGRVFHSPLGHNVKAISNSIEGELFRRGCAWTAGLKVKPIAKSVSGNKESK
jgi:type 1 glutamine amidotransferase